MEKVELTRNLRELYTATGKVKEVIAERGTFLCLDDVGDPGGETCARMVEQLFSVAYAVRRRLKKAGRLDFRVSRLEFRWMCDPKETPRSEWVWRVMVRVPDAVTKADLKAAERTAPDTKGPDIPRVKRVSWREGRALQVLHVGPREQAGPAYAKLRERADALGYRVRGQGHEVYLNTPARVPPDKLKTIVRLPIAWPRPEYTRGASERAV